MTSPTAGAVYLSASAHEGTLRAMAARILAAAPDAARRSPGSFRIAISYAAAGGSMVERGSHVIAKIFGGATITRFTVVGESGPGLTTPDEARAILAQADVIFVSGGDPVQGAQRLVRAGADVWLRDARARGTPCLGVSAGAMMLASWWAEWPEAPPHGAAHDGGELVACTAVVPGLVVDCHAEEDDWSELYLVRAMLRDREAGAAARMPRFLGLPTGTGIIVGADGAIVPVGGAPFELPALAPPS